MDSSQFGANSTLSGFAIRYRNHDYIADLVSPVLEVDPSSAFYYELGRTEEFDEYQTEVGGDEGSVTESKGTRNQKSYKTYDFSHAEHMPTAAAEEGALIGLPEIDLAVERVQDVVLRKREIKTQLILHGAANYGTAFKNTPSTKWNAETLKNLKAAWNVAIDVMDPKGNGKLVALFGLEAFRTLSTNANLIGMYTYNTAGIAELSESQVAQAMGVDQVVVGKAKRTTKIGDASTKTNIWGDNVSLHIVAPKPSLIVQGHNITFRRKVMGRPISAFDLPTDRGAFGGRLLKCSMKEGTQVVNDQCGYLWSDVST